MNVSIPQNCCCYNIMPPSGREGCAPHQPLCTCVGLSVCVSSGRMHVSDDPGTDNYI